MARFFLLSLLVQASLTVTALDSYGETVTPSIERQEEQLAVQQFAKECNEKDAVACENLADIEAQRDGSSADARRHYLLACQGCQLSACRKLRTSSTSDLQIPLCDGWHNATVIKDLAKSNYYRTPCDNGCGEACYLDGILESNLCHFQEAESRFRRGCEKKDPGSCAELGNHLRERKKKAKYKRQDIENAIAEFRKSVADPKSQACWNAMQTIRRMGYLAAEVIPDLIGLLKSEDSAVRYNAVTTLSFMGPLAKGAREDLNRIANGKDSKNGLDVSRAAGYALQMLDDQEAKEFFEVHGTHRLF